MDYLSFGIGVAVGGLVIGLFMALRLKGTQAELRAVREGIPNTFKVIAAEALESTLKMQTAQSQGELEAKRQAVEALVKPIRETLEKIESTRKEDYGGLTNATERLFKETRTLTTLLKEPQARGIWGETTLRRIVELAGLVEHCDFDVQVTQMGEEGFQRPDLVVYLPNNRNIAVDCKAPRTAYNRAMEAENEQLQKEALQQHAKDLSEHVKGLAKKTYWALWQGSPDFVVLFLPSEQLLTVALGEDPGLLEDAMSRQVVLATPSSLFSLLLAVKVGWREAQITENAKAIEKLGKELCERIANWTGHLQDMGRGLEKTIKAYNDGIGSLKGQVLVSAKRIKELGLYSDKEIPELSTVDIRLRQMPPVETSNTEQPEV